ncbi:hypothetical protein O0L34_g4880 [Tuta absoluta]|nr:hypothetical protein O0L34_g4880 [Tuta absoluta]
MLIPTCMIKFLELTLAVACLTLHHYSFDLTDIPCFMLCSGTYVGYVIVFSGEIVGEIVSAVADAYVDAWWSASGAAMFAGCGYMTLRCWKEVPHSMRRTYAQAAAACALAETALLIIDAILAICSAHRDEASSHASKGKSQCAM